MAKLKPYQKILLPIAGGTGLLFIPLLGDFHIESAILVTLTGCIWAGVQACRQRALRDDFHSALRTGGYLLLVGLPLLIRALLTRCFSIDGLVFWLLFPLPGIFFGYAVGRLLRVWRVAYRRPATVGILLLVGIGLLVFEFFNYPQVYFFNHVWGGWPGPIYDETVRVGTSTFFFRSLTLLWVALLWHIPTMQADRYSRWIVWLSALSIGFAYTQLADMGIISPRAHLQNVLGGSRKTAHFEIYYDREYYSEDEIALLAARHEFFLKQISDRLQLPPRDTTDKIESYLYAHPWQKKKLVGAKFTSYVPVWLNQDQLHIARQQIENSLKHELVHVLAKQFGNHLFNASWSIGLIEGLAVAIDKGPSSSSTVDQIVASEKPYPSSEELKRAFSPFGFYGGRSGVNYMTTGSFVAYLMDNYPVESLKRAYRSGDIVKAYQEDWPSLTQGWHRHLKAIEVDSLDREIASRIFSIPSLFEQECPHRVSDFEQAWDNHRYFQAVKDTAGVLRSLDAALAEAGSIPPVKAEWSYWHLMGGKETVVQNAASLKDTTLDLQLLYADAFAMTGDWERARLHAEKARVLFSRDPDSLLAPALATRANRRQWLIYRRMTYRELLPDSVTFGKALYRTKIRSLRKAMQRERWLLLQEYARQLLEEPARDQYFDDYHQMTVHLSFLGQKGLAERWLEKLSEMPLRNRYRQRLQSAREWLVFLSTYRRINH